MKRHLISFLAVAATAMAPLTSVADEWQMGDMYGPRMPDRWLKFDSYTVDYRNQPTAPKGQPRRYAFFIKRSRDASDAWIDQLIVRCAPYTMQGNVRVHNSKAAPIPSMFIKHYGSNMVQAPQGHGYMVPELLEQILLSDVDIERTSMTGDGTYKNGTETLSLTFWKAVYMDGHGKVKHEDNWLKR